MRHLKKGFNSAKYSTIAKTVPDHLSLFLKFSQLDENHSGTNSQSWLQRRHSSDDQVFAHATKNHSSFFRSAPYNTQFRRHKSSSSEAPAISTDVKSHNVAYTFNINGSMVDVRCSNGERSNTFRINRDLTAQTLLTRDGLESALASSSSAGSRKQDSSRRKRTNEKGKVAVDFKANPFLINSDESKLKCPNKKITLVKMVDVATSPALFFKSKTNRANNVYCVQIP